MNITEFHRNLFNGIFKNDTSIEDILSCIERCNKEYPSFLQKNNIHNYIQFFSILKELTPSHLKESLFPIYAQAKEEYIFKAHYKQIKTYETFFNFSLLCANEKKSVIKNFILRKMKNASLLSNKELLVEIFKHKLENILFEIMENNFDLLIFCHHNAQNYESKYIVNDKIQEIFEKHKHTFYQQYKTELLECKNELDYLNFRKKYSLVNKSFSLEYLDPFICYNTPLFNELFHCFEIFTGKNLNLHFYENYVFDNFITCFTKYNCLFSIQSFLEFYYSLKNIYPEHIHKFIPLIATKLKGVDFLYFLIDDFDTISKIIDSDVLMNLEFNKINSIGISEIPIHVWSFLYSKNKLFAKRLLLKICNHDSDNNFFETIDAIQEAFSVIDNLENF